ncbi:MAG: phosphoribosylformylglycinamidine synthase subunit PurQ, partial [Christiangramia sp.]
KQKYKDSQVISPGTVIISAAGHCNDITKVVEPVLQKNGGDIYYINLSQDKFKLGGSSFAQILNKVGKDVPTIKDDKKFAEAFNAMQELIKKDLILAGHDVASGGLITTLLEMCFADVNLGADLNLSALDEKDIVKLLFNENCGIVFQAKDNSVEEILKEKKVEFFNIGKVLEGKELRIKSSGADVSFNIPELRDTWYKTSFLLDEHQSGIDKATERYHNYKEQPLEFKFPEHFTGKLPELDSSKPRIKAAIIREKGSNSEREMARAMYLAGFDVKDVHMTDLITGRETLEDIQFIAAVGGFSNSDVLGSAKGWAGAFLYNEKAKVALDKFFARKDTLSLGVCNGCQLFIELGLINPEHDQKPKMLHNESHKFECNFTSVEVQENNSVMLSTLAGTKLGIWAAHGEGKFSFPYEEEKYNIVGKYGYEGYPANPNGSHYNTAVLTDDTGRHLVMMPHLERSTFQWNWANYPKGRKDDVSPWHEGFVNARKWLENKQ